MDLSALDGPIREKLIGLLEDGKSMYQLYMGVNFCLATYRFLGIFESKIQQADNAHIDSIAPLSADFSIEAGKSYTDVRFATTIGSGRIFGGFSDFLVETSGKSILCKNIEFTEVNDKKAVFI